MKKKEDQNNSGKRKVSTTKRKTTVYCRELNIEKEPRKANLAW